MGGGNSNVPLPPGAEVFKVTVGLLDDYLGVSDNYGSIQPNTFKGLEITELANTSSSSSDNYGLTITLGYYESVGQSVTAIRLDSGLEVRCDREGAGILWYSSTQKLFTDEDVNKTIKIALVAN